MGGEFFGDLLLPNDSTPVWSAVFDWCGSESTQLERCRTSDWEQILDTGQLPYCPFERSFVKANCYNSPPPSTTPRPVLTCPYYSNYWYRVITVCDAAYRMAMTSDLDQACGHYISLAKCANIVLGEQGYYECSPSEVWQWVMNYGNPYSYNRYFLYVTCQNFSLNWLAAPRELSLCENPDMYAYFLDYECATDNVTSQTTQSQWNYNFGISTTYRWNEEPVNVCVLFTADPCGVQGHCVGDLNGGRLCQCNASYTGPLCRSFGSDNLTECERRNQLLTFVLDMLNGFLSQPQELSMSMRDLLRTLQVTELTIPSCWDHSTPYGGTYKYSCTYDIDSLEQKWCICTDEIGVYNGLVYYDNACLNYTDLTEPTTAQRDTTQYPYTQYPTSNVTSPVTSSSPNACGLVTKGRCLVRVASGYNFNCKPESVTRTLQRYSQSLFSEELQSCNTTPASVCDIPPFDDVFSCADVLFGLDYTRLNTEDYCSVYLEVLMCMNQSTINSQWGHCSLRQVHEAFARNYILNYVFDFNVCTDYYVIESLGRREPDCTNSKLIAAAAVGTGCVSTGINLYGYYNSGSCPVLITYIAECLFRRLISTGISCLENIVEDGIYRGQRDIQRYYTEMQYCDTACPQPEVFMSLITTKCNALYIILVRNVTERMSPADRCVVFTDLEKCLAFALSNRPHCRLEDIHQMALNNREVLLEMLGFNPLECFDSRNLSALDTSDVCRSEDLYTLLMKYHCKAYFDESTESQSVDYCLRTYNGIGCLSNLSSQLLPNSRQCSKEEIFIGLQNSTLQVEESYFSCQNRGVIIARQGRVIIWQRGAWSRVCYEGWNHLSASVVCRQLGFQYAYAYNRSFSFYELGFEYLQQGYYKFVCNGSENSLQSCVQEWSYYCNYYNYLSAAVTCSHKEITYELVPAKPNVTYGYINMTRDSGSGLICSTYSLEYEAAKLCRAAGFLTGTVYPDQIISSNPDHVWRSSELYCYNAYDLEGCSTSGWELGPSLMPNDPYSSATLQFDCDTKSNNLIRVFCLNRALKFHTGFFNSSGIPQKIFPNDTTLTPIVFCYGFSDFAANLFCRAMGYPMGGRSLNFNPYYYNYFEKFVTLNCAGNETNFEDCQFQTYSYSCSRPAVLRCNHTSEVPELTFEIEQQVGNFMALVFTYYKGERGVICIDQWTDTEATAICTSKGYDGGFGGESYPGLLPYLLHNVSCQANSKSFKDCSFLEVQSESCGYSNGAGVRCYNQSDLVTYSLRGGSDNYGFVYVNVNNTEGLLCSDWYSIHYTKLCQTLGYQMGSQFVGDLPLPNGSTPVWSSYFSWSCKETTKNIDGCRMYDWGRMHGGISENGTEQLANCYYGYVKAICYNSPPTTTTPRPILECPTYGYVWYQVQSICITSYRMTLNSDPDQVCRHYNSFSKCARVVLIQNGFDCSPELTWEIMQNYGFYQTAYNYTFMSDRCQDFPIDWIADPRDIPLCENPELYAYILQYECAIDNMTSQSSTFDVTYDPGYTTSYPWTDRSDEPVPTQYQGFVPGFTTFQGTRTTSQQDNICGLFTSDPCGSQGTCTGDIFAGRLCQCSADYTGPLCRSLGSDNLTECERQSQLTTFVLDVMNGFLPQPQELPGSMRDFLNTLQISELTVPTCWDHSSPYGGTYKYMCTYDVENLELQACICTDSNGVYNGLAFYNQSCHNSAQDTTAQEKYASTQYSVSDVTTRMPSSPTSACGMLVEAGKCIVRVVARYNLYCSPKSVSRTLQRYNQTLLSEEFQTCNKPPPSQCDIQPDDGVFACAQALEGVDNTLLTKQDYCSVYLEILRCMSQYAVHSQWEQCSLQQLHEAFARRNIMNYMFDFNECAEYYDFGSLESRAPDCTNSRAMAAAAVGTGCVIEVIGWYGYNYNYGSNCPLMNLIANCLYNRLNSTLIVCSRYQVQAGVSQGQDVIRNYYTQIPYCDRGCPEPDEVLSLASTRCTALYSILAWNGSQELDPLDRCVVYHDLEKCLVFALSDHFDCHLEDIRKMAVNYRLTLEGIFGFDPVECFGTNNISDVIIEDVCQSPELYKLLMNYQCREYFVGSLNNTQYLDQCIRAFNGIACLARESQIILPNFRQCSQGEVLSAFRNSSLRMPERNVICLDRGLIVDRTGLVLLWQQGTWTSVCSEGWNQTAATVVCRQSGFHYGHAYTRPSLSFVPDVGYVQRGYTVIVCTGSEDSLQTCSQEYSYLCTNSYRSAAVSCSNTEITYELIPAKPNVTYGYISMTRDEGSGLICVTNRGETEANRLCRAAGFIAGTVYPDLIDAPSPSHVWRSEFNCYDSTDIEGCTTNGWEFGMSLVSNESVSTATLTFDCDSKSDNLFKVLCLNRTVKFHNGFFTPSGIPQLLSTDRTSVGPLMFCRYGFSDFAATLFCKEMGYPMGGQSLTFSPYYTWYDAYNYVSVWCSGNETKFEECQMQTYAYYCWNVAVVRCNHTAEAPDLSVLMEPSQQNYFSLVLTYYKGEKGVICADRWSENEARAVCRDRGYESGFGTELYPGLWPYLLHSVSCPAGSRSLTECSFTEVQSEVCQYRYAAAAHCYNYSDLATYRLAGGSSDNYGFVYVNFNHTEGLLCAYWTDVHYTRLCQSLGYRMGGAYLGDLPLPNNNTVVWNANFIWNCPENTTLEACRVSMLQPLNVSRTDNGSEVLPYCYYPEGYVKASCYNFPATTTTPRPILTCTWYSYYWNIVYDICGVAYRTAMESDPDQVCHHYKSFSKCATVVLLQYGYECSPEQSWNAMQNYYLYLLNRNYTYLDDKCQNDPIRWMVDPKEVSLCENPEVYAYAFEYECPIQSMTSGYTPYPPTLSSQYSSAYTTYPWSQMTTQFQEYTQSSDFTFYPGSGTTQSQDNITKCERQNQVMTYVLGVLNGSIPKPQELPGSMRDFLRTLHVTELIVPTCWDHSTSYGGTFKYICTYDIDTLEQKWCICTDENGVYNGLTYYDQACHYNFETTLPVTNQAQSTEYPYTQYPPSDVTSGMPSPSGPCGDLVTAGKCVVRFISRTYGSCPSKSMSKTLERYKLMANLDQDHSCIKPPTSVCDIPPEDNVFSCAELLDPVDNTFLTTMDYCSLYLEVLSCMSQSARNTSWAQCSLLQLHEAFIRHNVFNYMFDFNVCTDYYDLDTLERRDPDCTNFRAVAAVAIGNGCALQIIQWYSYYNYYYIPQCQALTYIANCLQGRNTFSKISCSQNQIQTGILRGQHVIRYYYSQAPYCDTGCPQPQVLLTMASERCYAVYRLLIGNESQEMELVERCDIYNDLERCVAFAVSDHVDCRLEDIHHVTANYSDTLINVFGFNPLECSDSRNTSLLTENVCQSPDFYSLLMKYHCRGYFNGSTNTTQYLDKCLRFYEGVACLSSSSYQLLPNYRQCSQDEVMSTVQNYTFDIQEDISCLKQRLIIGRTRQVLVWQQGTWWTVCSEGWNQISASVVCRQLGFQYAYAYNRSTSYYESGIGYINRGSSKIVCNGSENSLQSCSQEWSYFCYYYSYASAAVNCYHNEVTYKLVPAEPNATYGYISMTRDENAGLVCSPYFGDLEAAFLCRAAGFAGGEVSRDDRASVTENQVWRSYLSCSSTSDIEGCSGDGWQYGPSQMDNTSGSSALAFDCTSRSGNLVYVSCFNKSIRLHTTQARAFGIPQMYISGTNTPPYQKATFCRDGFTNYTASLVCKELGFSQGGLSLNFNPFQFSSDLYYGLHVFSNCRGNETEIKFCGIDVNSWRTCSKLAVVRCHQNPEQVPELSVKLEKLPVAAVQRVLVYYDNSWGAICADSWSDTDATTICRMVGYDGGFAKYVDQGLWPYLLHNVSCSENTTSWGECHTLNLESDDCVYRTAAGVFCYNHNNLGKFSLLQGSADNYGFVTLKYNNTQGYVCAFWGSFHFNTLCQTLGFFSGEQYLDDLPLANFSTSVWSASFSWDCQGKTTMEACRDGEWFQLTNNDTDHGSLLCNTGYLKAFCYNTTVKLHSGLKNTTGIPQLYYGGQYLDVCRQSFTDDEDNLFCQQILQSPSAQAILLPSGTYTYYASNDKTEINTTCFRSRGLVKECIRSVAYCYRSDFQAVHCYDGERPNDNITDWRIREDGLVMAKMYNTWGTVCGGGFDSTAIKLLCQSQGYPYGTQKQIYHRSTLLPQWVSWVSCPASPRSNFSNCAVTPTTTNCYSYFDAAVRCYGRDEYTEMFLTDIDYQPSSVSGRVAVKRNGTTGYLCSYDYYYYDQASILCRLMGYNYGNMMYGYLPAINNSFVIWSATLTCNSYDANLEVLGCYTGWTQLPKYDPNVTLTSQCSGWIATVACYPRETSTSTTTTYSNWPTTTTTYSNWPTTTTTYSNWPTTSSQPSQSTPKPTLRPCPGWGTVWSIVNQPCRLYFNLAADASSGQACRHYSDFKQCAAYMMMLNNFQCSEYTLQDMASDNYWFFYINTEQSYSTSLPIQCAGTEQCLDSQLLLSVSSIQCHTFLNAVLKSESQPSSLTSQCRAYDDLLRCISVAISDRRYCGIQDVYQMALTYNSTFFNISGFSLEKCYGAGILSSWKLPEDVCQSPDFYKMLMRYHCKGHFNVSAHLYQNPDTCTYFFKAVSCLSGQSSQILPASRVCTQGEVINALKNSEFRQENDGRCLDRDTILGGSGRVLKRQSVGWTTLCGLDWSDSEARVLCRQLGFSHGYAYERSSYAHEEGIDGVQRSLIKVSCKGSETALQFCKQEWSQSCFYYYKSAAAVCSHTEITYELVPANPNATYGYINVTREGGAGLLCLTHLSDVEATSLCQAAGFLSGMVYRDQLSPPVTSLVWRTYMLCSEDTDIESCFQYEWQLGPSQISSQGSRELSFSCNADSDNLARVFCYDKPLRLHTGLFNSTGIPQMHMSKNSLASTWVPFCRDGFTDFAADLFCKKIGFQKGGTSIPFKVFKESDYNTFVLLNCSGWETEFQDCSTGRDSRGCTDPAVVQCNHSLEAVPEFSLRRERTSDPLYSRVLTYYRGEWGVICADVWSDSEASALCRAEGFVGGFGSKVDPGLRPFILHNVTCPEDSASLRECGFSELRSNVCQDEYAAAVFCYNNNSLAEFSLHGGASENYGFVYVNFNSTPGLLCADWSDVHYNTLCQSLGYYAGERYYEELSLPNTSTPLWGSYFRQECFHSNLEACRTVEWYSYRVNADNETTQKIPYCYQRGGYAKAYCYNSIVKLHTGSKNSTGILQAYVSGKFLDLCSPNLGVNSTNMMCQHILRSPLAKALPIPSLLFDGPLMSGRASAVVNSSCLASRGVIIDCVSVSQDWCSSSNFSAVHCYEGQLPKDNVTDWKVVEGGLVMVYKYDTWGTVCSSGFDASAAKLLCQWLGYAGGFVRPSVQYSSGRVPQWVHSVSCPTAEGSTFNECVLTPTNSASPCSAMSDSIVKCYRNDEYTEAFLMDVRYQQTTVTGRVTIRRNGTTGYLCRSGLYFNEPNVLCRSMGYPNGGYIASDEQLPPADRISPLWYTSPVCNLLEANSDLMSCYDTWGQEAVYYEYSDGGDSYRELSPCSKTIAAVTCFLNTNEAGWITTTAFPNPPQTTSPLYSTTPDGPSCPYWDTVWSLVYQPCQHSLLSAKQAPYDQVCRHYAAFKKCASFVMLVNSYQCSENIIHQMASSYYWYFYTNIGQFIPFQCGDFYLPSIVNQSSVDPCENPDAYNYILEYICPQNTNDFSTTWQQDTRMSETTWNGENNYSTQINYRNDSSTTPPLYRPYSSTASPPLGRSSSFETPPDWQYGSSTPPPNWQYNSSTPPPYWQYGSSTPPSNWQYGSSTPPPFWLYGSSTPPPFWQYGSSTPPPYWQNGSSTPPPNWQYGSSTTPPYWQYSSSTPPPNWRYNSSTPPPYWQYGSSTPPPYWQYGSYTPSPNWQYNSNTPSSYWQNGSSTPPPYWQYSSSTSPPNWQYGSSTPPPYWQYSSSTPPPYWQYGSSTSSPYWPYGSTTPPPNWQYGSSTAPPYWQYGSSTPPPFWQYGSSTPPQNWQYGSSSPPPYWQYGSSSSPPNWQYNSSTPPPNWQYGSSTPPPFWQYGSSTPPPYWQYGSSTTPPNWRYNSSTPPPYWQYGSSTPPSYWQNGSSTSPPYWQYGSSTPPPYWQYGSSTSSPNWPYGSTTPPPNWQYISTTLPPNWQYGSTSPPPYWQYGSTTPPRNWNNTSSSPPPFWQYGSSTPPPYWQYGSSTSPPYWQYSSSTPTPYWQYSSSTPPPYWQYGSSTSSPNWPYGSTTPPPTWQYSSTTSPPNFQYDSTTFPYRQYSSSFYFVSSNPCRNLNNSAQCIQDSLASLGLQCSVQRVRNTVARYNNTLLTTQVQQCNEFENQECPEPQQLLSVYYNQCSFVFNSLLTSGFQAKSISDQCLIYEDLEKCVAFAVSDRINCRLEDIHQVAMANLITFARILRLDPVLCTSSRNATNSMIPDDACQSQELYALLTRYQCSQFNNASLNSTTNYDNCVWFHDLVVCLSRESSGILPVGKQCSQADVLSVLRTTTLGFTLNTTGCVADTNSIYSFPRNTTTSTSSAQPTTSPCPAWTTLWSLVYGPCNQTIFAASQASMGNVCRHFAAFRKCASFVMMVNNYQCSETTIQQMAANNSGYFHLNAIEFNSTSLPVLCADASLPSIAEQEKMDPCDNFDVYSFILEYICLQNLTSFSASGPITSGPITSGPITTSPSGNSNTTVYSNTTRSYGNLNTTIGHSNATRFVVHLNSTGQGGYLNTTLSYLNSSGAVLYPNTTVNLLYGNTTGARVSVNTTVSGLSSNASNPLWYPNATGPGGYQNSSASTLFSNTTRPALYSNTTTVSGLYFNSSVPGVYVNTTLTKVNSTSSASGQNQTTLNSRSSSFPSSWLISSARTSGSSWYTTTSNPTSTSVAFPDLSRPSCRALYYVAECMQYFLNTIGLQCSVDRVMGSLPHYNRTTIMALVQECYGG